MLQDHEYGASASRNFEWCVLLHPSSFWYHVILLGGRSTWMRSACRESLCCCCDRLLNEVDWCRELMAVVVGEAGPEAGEEREDGETALRDESSSYSAPTEHRTGQTGTRQRQVRFPHRQTWRSRECCWFFAAAYVCVKVPTTGMQLLPSLWQKR